MEENTTKSDRIINRSIEDEMEESYLQYSMSVIVARALPDVRDGLKPVHRRILYAMHNRGWRSNSKHVKSAKIVGEVIGNYHPHGDQAVYDSMVRMAQDWAMRYTLINPQGNFGSMDGDPPAAHRYTEAKLARISEEMLADLDKETVAMRPNFDGTEDEPSVLPAKLPNLLLNGQLGIAVGMATNIPPHNLGELIDAVKLKIDNPDVTIEELLKVVKGPDFPTGATVYGGESMKEAYTTGRGGIIIRSKAEIVDSGKRQSIIITEIPYGQNKASLIEKMADLFKEKKISGIHDLRDESSRTGVRIVVELKKDSYPNKVLNQLYKLSPLQTSYHYNMLALVNGIQPQVLGLQDMLGEYIKHRFDVVTKRTQYELRKAKERAHILEGLVIALDNIDEIIEIIRSSQTQDDAKLNLIKRFKLSEIQAKAILSMQLRSLVGLERQALEEQLAELKKLIANLEAILGDGSKVYQIIKDELDEIKSKYGDERKTVIINSELGKFSDEELIPDENVVVIMTTENYIKRVLASDFSKQNRGGRGKRGMSTKEADVISNVVSATTHDLLMFFTSKGRLFVLKGYEVPVMGLNAKGVAAVNLLQLHPEEKITAILNAKSIDSAREEYVFMVTSKGVVKKTKISDYRNVRSSGIIAINIDDNDELKWVRITDGNNEVIVSTAKGQSLRFDELDVRPMGRTARGVRGIRLKGEDQVVGMDVVMEGQNIFLISEKGYGKRTAIDQFSKHKRGGVGIKAAVVNTKTGDLVSVCALNTDLTEVIIISQKGQTIRLGIKDISKIGRATQGVRLMRLAEGDTVASTALVDGSQSVDEEDIDK
ncbi:MAG TPA: DNA gyrase subunit A [Candidatus Saccharibacteria bacterium]|jgi:DNA gyrase subunit A|nr:DNA gyrase subunit A [Candidatus Saccharibacteria bacterium]